MADSRDSSVLYNSQPSSNLTSREYLSNIAIDTHLTFNMKCAYTSIILENVLANARLLTPLTRLI